MLRKLLAIVALMIWATPVLQGEEFRIEQVGEPEILVDSAFQYQPTPLTLKDFTEIRPPRAGDPNLNAITKEPLPFPYVYTHFAVGDRGKVFKIDGFNQTVVDSAVLLNGAYNLTGISFAPNSYTGWIVGYKRDNWQGLILKTMDTGRTWIPQTNIQPPFPGNIAVPFLDVWAVNENYVWISCAHGYVLWTRNGGDNWLRVSKPGGDTHYGWLWGVWAYDSTTAWVCSDQSGLVAKTINSGNTWTVFRPGEQITPRDTFLSFRDISPKPRGLPDPTKIELAASNGKVVYTTNNGATWSYYLSFNTDKQWFSGLFDEGYVYDFSYVCGSGGTVARGTDYPGPLWYSKQYDLNNIGGKGWMSANYLVAIGTNSAVIGSKEVNAWENRFYISSINASSGAPMELTWGVTNTCFDSQDFAGNIWYSFQHEEDYATSPSRFYTELRDRLV